jgi:hypothetical protein
MVQRGGEIGRGVRQRPVEIEYRNVETYLSHGRARKA